MEEKKCCCSQKKLQEIDVKSIVRQGYAQISTGAEGCCTDRKNLRFGHNNPLELAKSVGYAKDDLELVPEGANLGVSCGNPVALAGLRAGECVLDLGCGGGFDVFQASFKVGVSGRVIGVDMTPEMLELAQKNLAKFLESGGPDNIEFRLEDIEAMTLEQDSVDVVLSNCVLNLVPDKQRAWAEIYRVLKPGGRVSVSDLALLRDLPVSVRNMKQAMVGCVGGAILVEKTKEILESRGFRQVVFTPNHEYVKNMLSWNDPLYRDISAALPQGHELSEYIVSMGIEAVK